MIPKEDPGHEDITKLFSIQHFPPGMTMTKRGNLLEPSQEMASEARPVSFDLLVKDVSIKWDNLLNNQCLFHWSFLYWSHYVIVSPMM